jgi:hypothetical protein
MKDIGRTISTIYSTLLGSITYGGKAVPFYTEEPWKTTGDNFIVLLNIEHTPDNNDQRFVANATVTLDVVTKQSNNNSRAAADGIASAVLQALLPGTYVDREDADFQVMIRDARSTGYIRSQNGSTNINRKILTINNHLTQKQ